MLSLNECICVTLLHTHVHMHLLSQKRKSNLSFPLSSCRGSEVSVTSPGRMINFRAEMHGPRMPIPDNFRCLSVPSSVLYTNGLPSAHIDIHSHIAEGTVLVCRRHSAVTVAGLRAGGRSGPAFILVGARFGSVGKERRGLG